MKKFSFVATVILSGVMSTTAIAQNYYDPGFYQNNNYGYSNNYNYAAPTYQQNYGYYPQQTSNATSNNQPASNRFQTSRNNTNKLRGIGTISIGADYVLGFTKFNSEEHNLGNLITGSDDYIFDTDEFERKSDAISFNIGWRPFKYIGIEAYYLSSFGADKEENVLSQTNYSNYVTTEQEVSYKSYGIDIIGYYPINDYIELLASIGVGKYDVEADATISARDVATTSILSSKNQNFEDSITAYRIGGGFQLWMSRHLAFRVTGRYTKLGGNLPEYITEINAGVRYHF